MKLTHILSVPLLVLVLTGTASATRDPYDPFSLGEGGSPSVGEEVWRLTTPPKAPSNTRARVLAELHEAQRLGLLHAGEGDVPVATVEQERLIALARARAGQPEVANR